MNFTKEIILPAIALVFAVLAVVAVITGFYLLNMSSTCVADGGQFIIDGPVAMCNY